VTPQGEDAEGGSASRIAGKGAGNWVCSLPPFCRVVPVLLSGARWWRGLRIACHCYGKVAQGQSMIPVLKSEQAADFIVAGVEKDAREAIEPRRLRALLTFARFFPGLVQTRAGKR